MKDALANPAPLGLMGFGMTTVLLNIHNAGFFENDIMILAMGIFYGGLAQVIAGIMEFKKGNTFGTTAFTSFGLFTGLEVLSAACPLFILQQLKLSMNQREELYCRSVLLTDSE